MEVMTKQSLYSDDVYQECLDRIEQLTPQTEPEWGKMNVAQMLAHCAEVVEVSNGKHLRNTPFMAWLVKGIIRNMVLSEEPYPKNSKTHPQYVQAMPRDFETQKNRLLEALSKFKKGEGKVRKHPIFGEMTVEEQGWSAYKHLDHHLRQFGV